MKRYIPNCKLIATESIHSGQVSIWQEIGLGRVRFYWIDESNKASAGYFFSREAAEKDAIQHANKKEEPDA